MFPRNNEEYEYQTNPIPCCGTLFRGSSPVRSDDTLWTSCPNPRRTSAGGSWFGSVSLAVFIASRKGKARSPSRTAASAVALPAPHTCKPFPACAERGKTLPQSVGYAVSNRRYATFPILCLCLRLQFEGNMNSACDLEPTPAMPPQSLQSWVAVDDRP